MLKRKSVEAFWLGFSFRVSVVFSGWDSEAIWVGSREQESSSSRGPGTPIYVYGIGRGGRQSSVIQGEGMIWVARGTARGDFRGYSVRLHGSI